MKRRQGQGAGGDASLAAAAVRVANAGEAADAAANGVDVPGGSERADARALAVRVQRPDGGRGWPQ